MRTYELIVSEFSSFSFDEKVFYLRSLTTPELNLFREKLTREDYSFPLIVSMVDAILLERLPQIREDKLNEILK
jgi:hypothetical protein